MMGSSKDLAVGTVAVASLLMGAMLGAEVNAVQNPTLYLHLAFTATFFAGVFQASLGLLRQFPSPFKIQHLYFNSQFNKKYLHGYELIQARVHRGFFVTRNHRRIHGRRCHRGVLTTAQRHPWSHPFHSRHRSCFRSSLCFFPNSRG